MVVTGFRMDSTYQEYGQAPRWGLNMGQKGNSVRNDQAGMEDLLEFLREGRILNRIAQVCITFTSSTLTISFNPESQAQRDERAQHHKQPGGPAGEVD